MANRKKHSVIMRNSCVMVNVVKTVTARRRQYDAEMRAKVFRNTNFYRRRTVK